MTVVSVRFLSGAYHATPWGHHVNEGAVEWPPSPWRFLRALIATWKLTMPEVSDGQMRALLGFLSGAPDFQLPAGTVTSTRHYMPLYASGKTTLVVDSFMALEKEAPVKFVWTTDLGPQERALLGELLANLPYLGRAESWCKASLDTSAMVNCYGISDARPARGDHDIAQVLIPRPEVTLEQLMVDTGDLRQRLRRIDPPGSEWALYSVERAGRMVFAGPRRKDFPARPTVARFAMDAKPLPRVAETLSVAEAIRAAAMSQYGRLYGERNSATLSGREDGAGPLKGHRHAHYLPVDDDGDGRLDHIVVYAAAGLDERECRALANIDALVMREQEIHTMLLGFAHTEAPAPEAVLGTSSVWESITPFVMARHPKRFRDGTPKLNDMGEQVDGPEDQIRREWEYRRQSDPNLPPIITIEPIRELRVRGRRVSWLEFRYYRSSSSAPSPAAIGNGYRLTFGTPVRGPVALGYACHYGMGLFAPAETGGVQSEGNASGDLD